MRDTTDFIIQNEIDYERFMGEIEDLMDKGESNLTIEESDLVRNMAIAAQAYEQKNYRTKMPNTLPEMISLRMYEMKLKQNEVAKKLGVSDTKLSLILHGKQKPDIKFIKALHSKLQVPADFILTHI